MGFWQVFGIVAACVFTVFFLLWLAWSLWCRRSVKKWREKNKRNEEEVELKKEERAAASPQIERLNFKIDFDVNYNSLLKKAFGSYKMTGASEEWAAGFRAAVSFCQGIIDDFSTIGKGNYTDEES